MPLTDSVKLIFEVALLGAGSVAGLSRDMGKLTQEYQRAFRATEEYREAQAKQEVLASRNRAALNSLGRDLAKGNITVEQATATWQRHSKELTDAQEAFRRLDDETKKADVGLGAFTKGVQSGLTTIAALAAGVIAVGKAFEQALDWGEQGAAVSQTQLSFAMLNEKLHVTVDMLGDMQKASRGTIADVDLMASYMTLLAGTQGEVAQAFSDSAAELVEISKAAAILNPTLGDTNYMFESITTGIKRQSFRLLDNLGIIIRFEAAQRTYADSIGKTVEELTAEEKTLAGLYETIRVGRILVEQTGGDARALTDAYQQLTAETTNWANELKAGWDQILRSSGLVRDLGEFMNLEALRMEIGNLGRELMDLGVSYDLLYEIRRQAGIEQQGLLSGVAGNLVNQNVDALSQSLRDQELVMRALTDAQSLSADEVDRLIGYVQILNPQLTELAIREIDAGMGAMQRRVEYDKLAGVLRQLSGQELPGYIMATSRAGTAIQIQGDQIQTSVPILDGYGNVIGEVILATEEQKKSLDELLVVQEEEVQQAEAGTWAWLQYVGAIGYVSKADAVAYTEKGRLNRAVRENEAAYRREADALWERVYAFRANTDAQEGFLNSMRVQGDLIDALLDPQNRDKELFTVDVAFLGTRRVSQMTGQQAEDLERLRGVYETTERQIRDYQLGILGVSYTEGERAEKVGELTQKLRNLEAAMTPLIAAQNTYGTVTNTAVWNDKALQDALYELTLEADPTHQALMGLAESTKYLSTEQATAILKTEAMQAYLGNLAQDLADRKITWEEAIGLIEEFKESLEDPFFLKFGLTKEAVEAMTQTSTWLDRMREEFGPGGGRIAYHVDVYWETHGTPYSGPPPSSGGGPDDGERFTQGDNTGMQAGGWVYGRRSPGDTVRALLEVGERVLSVRDVARMGGPRVVDDLAKGRRSGEQPITVTVNAYGSRVDPRQIASEVVRKITVGG